ncbi:MAG TPA: aminotransferase class V-fold PLP-dependent enzyme [Longimicrobiales bacterium]
MLNLDASRADTPGTAHCVHFNNAGAGLMPTPVLDAIREHLELEGRVGGYEAATLRRAEIRGVYESMGRLLGCPAENVALTENATASFAAALSAIPFGRGDVILTTRNDYVSNQIQYLSLSERLGVEVLRAPDLPEGGVDVRALKKLVHRRRPRLVAVTHIPTNSGLVQDVGAVARACAEAGVPCLVDACQSVGQMPVDVTSIPCDFLSGTARKFLRGPRGMGFLYVSDRALDAGLMPLFPDLHGADWVAEDLFQPAPDARRFENWEFPYALVLGLGVAARYASNVGLEAIRERSWSLAARIRDGLEAMGARVLDRGTQPCAIVTTWFEGHEPQTLVEALRRERVNTSASELSFALLDFHDKGVTGALRISPHYYNTEDEVDGFLDLLAGLVGG